MPLNLDHVADAPDISDEELIAGFATLMAAMRKRGIIRTKNVVGDLGERYAERAYRTNQTKRRITLAGTNATDVDALDVDGVRFAIKAASPSSTRTSAFHLKMERTEAESAFDYLIVVRVDDLLQPTHVYELTWKQFWDAKSWNTRQQAWFLPLTRKVLGSAQKVFPINENRG